MRGAPFFTIAFFAFLAPWYATAQDQSSIDAGAALYDMHCAECHGARLVNTGSAFDLKLLTADEKPRFDKSVMEGKGQMPAWRGTLTQDAVDQLWAYIRSKAYQ
jgi:mono/diheme cytochrome c family protein